MDKEILLEQIRDNFNLSSDEAQAALLLLDTRAANLDLSLDEYIEAYHPAGFSQKDAGLSSEYKGYVQFNYELLYNGKDIAGLPPVVGRGKDNAAVRQPVCGIKPVCEKYYGMEIG